MADVAFYAPMKPPTHGVPSGDREMARNLMRVIGARATVDLASQLRVRDPDGDGGFQDKMMKAAMGEVQRVIARLKGKDIALWVTYHNYYKAPDLIGPPVCRALNLAYVQIETTRARSRLQGPWAGFAQAAEAASDAADIVFYLTELDLITLKRDQAPDQKLVHLRPFLVHESLPDVSDTGSNVMLSVGMMRAGDKLASYRIIADTLDRLPGDWRLEIVGDGPARAEVVALMARFGPKVTFLGQLDRDELACAYNRAGLFFWPGVNEAYGMVYLEAQSAGLPVVAQDRPGVRDVVLAGVLPLPEAGPEALAACLARLLNDPAERRALGRQARAEVEQNHLITAATDIFWNAVTPLIEARQ
ncbi:MAG: glycosyltransferase [Rhodobacteraceae bacterium]|nr:glycosyltransferase [Paracoccaceae bacterium]